MSATTDELNVKVRFVAEEDKQTFDQINKDIQKVSKPKLSPEIDKNGVGKYGEYLQFSIKKSLQKIGINEELASKIARPISDKIGTTMTVAIGSGITKGMIEARKRASEIFKDVKIPKAEHKTEFTSDELKEANDNMMAQLKAMAEQGYDENKTGILLPKKKKEPKVYDWENAPKIDNTTLSLKNLWNTLKTVKVSILGVKVALSTLLVVVAAVVGVVKLAIAVFKLVEKTIKTIAKVVKETAKVMTDYTKTVAVAFGKGVLTLIVGIGKAIKKVADIAKSLGVSIKTGLSGLYEWAKPQDAIRGSLDTIKSCIDSISAGLASMAAPLINVLAPIIDSLTDKILTLMNAIGRLFAMLTSSGTFMKATKANTKFAESAGSAAKEVNNLTTGIDELNIVSAGDTSGGGTTTSIGFANEELENFLSYFDSGKALGHQILKWFDNIDWNGIKRKANEIGSNIAEYLNGVFSTPALGSVIGNGIAQAFNTAFEFLKGSNGIDAKKLGQQISDTIGSIFDNLNYQTIHSAVSGALSNISTIINTLFGSEENVNKVSDGIGTLLSNAFNDITDFISDINWGSIADFITDTMKKTIQGANPKKLADGISGALEGALKLLANTPLAEMATFAMEFVNQLGDNLVKALNGSEGQTQFDDVVDNIVAGINAIVEGLDAQKMANLINSMIDAFERAWTKLRDDVDWDDLVDKICNALAEVDWAQLLGVVFEVIEKCWCYKLIFKNNVFEEICIDIHDHWMKAIENLSDKWTGLGKTIAKCIISGIEGLLRSFNIAGVIADIIEVANTTSENKIKTMRKKLNYYSGGLFFDEYATGGFPTTGELFVAREAGPELVGSFGGKTAVANNDQIISGISLGVYEAVASAMSQYGNSNNGNVCVYLDGKQIENSIRETRQRRGATIATGGILNYT